MSNIEKIDSATMASYELSPNQEGMLYHTLREPHAGLFFLQMLIPVPNFDKDAYLKAWEMVIAHHDILRTSFHWEDADTPYQIVHEKVQLPVVEVDLSDIGRFELRGRLREILREDRRLGFDLKKAPLLRLTLVDAGNNFFYVIKSHHHIILDGWSGGIVLRDVQNCYRAIRQRKQPKLPAAGSYREYIRWLRGRNLREAEEFWKKSLSGVEKPTPLPGEQFYSKKVRVGERFFTRKTTVSASVFSTVKKIAKEWRVTPSTILHGLWAMLLSMYSGEKKVVFGTTFTGRPTDLQGVENIAGLFINVLPLPISIEGESSLKEWVQGIHGQILQTQKFEFTPLVQVQGWSAVPRGKPLFEILFVYNSAELGTLSSGKNKPKGGKGRKESADGDASDLRDLTRASPTNDPIILTVGAGEELHLDLTVDARRVDISLIHQILEQFTSLVERFITVQNGKVEDLHKLPPMVEHKLLHVWNRTERDFSQKPVLLHHLVEEQVDRTPDATALVYEDISLTYREFNSRANQLAHYLHHKLGVHGDVIVGVFAERSIDLVLALHAVVKAGGAYVPLDPELPAERLQLMVEDAGIDTVLTQRHIFDKAPKVSNLILLDEYKRYSSESTSNLDIDISCENLAYVIYTSGSTGRPKGVMIEHRGICNRLHWMQEEYLLGEQDVVLQKTPFSFDVSVWEFFWPLTSGASLVVARPGGHKDPSYLKNLIIEKEITTLHFVPPMLDVFLDEPGVDQCYSLARVICSGDALSGDTVDRFYSTFSAAELHNLYGPTEASIDVTYWFCERNRRDGGIPIGKPIANMKVYVLDESLRLCPIGVPGELHLSGVGLARGYLRRPDLTEKAFIRNPFSDADSAYDRMYKTGDLCRWLPDGSLEFLGRIDHQVKIRGFRVELGEIEAQLRLCPGVRQSVVLAQPDPAGGSRLVAYVVPEDDEHTPSSDDLRDHLSKKLPEYMVPSIFVFLEEMPLTANAKIDRKALPNPDAKTLQIGKEYVAPRNATEETIAKVWSDVLKVDNIGALDNFFDLGGHSLLVTRAVTAIKKELGIHLPITALFDAPTVEKLALWIQEHGNSGEDAEENPFEAFSGNMEEGRIAPQSFAQQRLWFLCSIAEGTALYNMSGAVPFDEPVDVDALKLALNELCRRHESLRTTFISQDGEPIQVIAPPSPVPLEIVDLRGRDFRQRRSMIRRIQHEMDSTVYDLSKGPLVRFILIMISNRRQLLFYGMHHIITDGWSMSVCQYEIQTLYSAFKRGQPSPLPDPEFQYADFAIWQRKWLQGKVLEEQIDYWVHRLDGISMLNLPTDHARPKKASYQSAIVPLEIPEDVARGLYQLAKDEEATIFMVLLAAFQYVLGKNAGQDDVAVATPIANRNRPELEMMIGFFVNTLVMRTDLSQASTFRDLLKIVRRNCLDAYNHQDLPFEKLVEEIAPERGLNIQPLTQVLFVLQNTPKFANTPSDRRPTRRMRGSRPQGDNNAKPEVAAHMYFDLAVSLTEADGRLQGGLHYNVDLFDRSSGERFARHFLTLLKFVSKHAEQPLGISSLLSAQEREKLLDRANTHPDESAQYPIHVLVTRAARRDPKKTALVFEQEEWSYARLESQSNRLAHYLRGIGVTTDVRVGVCLERGIDLVVCMLAIFKSGGVYVPINPELPPERLNWLIEDSSPKVVLSRESLHLHIDNEDISVVDLDALESVLQHTPDTPLECVPDPHDLAYIIYTSGSTGRPKGVMIEHHSLSHTIAAQIPLFDISPRDRVLATVAPSFDASLGEIFRTLVGGATLYMAPKEKLLPSMELVEFLKENRITKMTMVPTLLSELPSHIPLPDLDTITVGGEAIPIHLAKKWKRGRRLLNGYGPTETCIGATLATDWEIEEKPPLGFPLPGVKIYILGKDLELLPDGVPGEIFIGGPGLARGYLNQPELTRKSFVRNPFSDDPSERLYRTGDIAKWRKDGQLEFLGRRDEQVKIRGYRIEPGEVASVIKEFSDIKDAVVVARPYVDRPQESRLVAYVIAEDTKSKKKDAVGLVDEWHKASDVASEKVLDEQAEHVDDPRMNFSGWTSSYTGKNIPKEEMAAWADSTINRIRSLNPENVLEVGSGSGLILLRLAPYCKHYVGLDFAEGLLKQTASYLHLIEDSGCRVELLHRRADELEGIKDRFDTLVVNSVVQYFPNIRYLLEVLEKSLALIEKNGKLFLGDLRNFCLLDEFHASVQFAKASPTLSCAQLQQRVKRHISLERELLIDPRFFVKLLKEIPRVAHVQALPKEGPFSNELTVFRYDVVVYLDEPPKLTDQDIEWLEYSATSDGKFFDLLQVNMKEGRCFGIRDIPNLRICKHHMLVTCLQECSSDKNKQVSDVREFLEKTNVSGVEPKDLHELAMQHGYTCELSWLSGSAKGNYDAVFMPSQANTSLARFPYSDIDCSKDWDAYANDPSAAAMERNLIMELRDYMSNRLPDYMIPADLVMLDHFPMTAHGKLDYKSLPEPEGEARAAESSAKYVEPRNDDERNLAKIWMELLRVERVGIDDNFFDLGGDSILSIRAIARAAEVGINLTPAQVYEYQTIREQVAIARAGESDGVVSEQGIITGDVPFTPIQHWYFSANNPDPHHFNWAIFIPAKQGLREEDYRNVMRELLSHHDALRLRIRHDETGGYRQFIDGVDDDIPVTIDDMSEFKGQEQRARIEEKAEEYQRALNLEHGPMIALHCFRMGGMRPDLLLLIANHLILDVVSWSLIREDLATLMQQVKESGVFRLPAKTSSFKDWAETLQKYERAMPEEERNYWLRIARDVKDASFSRLQIECEESEDIVGNAREYAAVLGDAETQELIRLSQSMGAGIDEILLIVMGMMLLKKTECAISRIDVERHGREDLDPNLNFTRTVGWFANISPVILKFPKDASPKGMLESGLKQIREIPKHGIGYGVMRYLSDDPDTRSMMASIPRADVFFNYFGMVGGRGNMGGGMGGEKRKSLQPSTGTTVSPRNARRYPIDINAIIIRGGLLMRWGYNIRVSDEARISSLANEYYAMLRSVIQ